MKNLIYNILSIIHFRSAREGFFNLIITAFSFISAYYGKIVLDNIDLFMAIASVVIIDWLAGTALALKKGTWETQKALKIIYYLAAYWLILAMVLSVEKGFASAFWLSEAIIMPIMVFQTISILKNCSLVGLIPKGLLLEILEKIDGYKHKNTNEKKEENE
jgi:phage-related holin